MKKFKVIKTKDLPENVVYIVDYKRFIIFINVK